MAVITSNSKYIEIDGNVSLSLLDNASVTKTVDGVRLRFSSGSTYDVSFAGTTLDGITINTNQELYNFFKEKGFSEGGGDGNGVTQTELDARIPSLQLNNFLVGGTDGNYQRKILPIDVGHLSGTGLRLVSVLNGDFTNSYAATSTPLSESVLVRTSTGAGTFSPATSPDEAVVLSQHQSGLELKVDKVAGKVLSDTSFTAAEKAKLAGLEDVHYKGWFSNLTALQTNYPTSDEGAHAFVDDVSGAVLYIWDVDSNSWTARLGESTEMTPAQAKVLYESNPDTNAFTDDEKSKLASITSAFTSALKTSYDNAVSWISSNGVNLLNHLTNKSNPHEVTAIQVGLGNVDNTSDANKPISTATQNSLDNKVDFPSTNSHIPVRTSGGGQGSQPFTSTVAGNSIMFRDGNGRSRIAAPTEDTHIANKAYADRVWSPDYSNMETVNRIPTSGGTWTVPSGFRGFVKLYSRNYTAGIQNSIVFLINGNEMERIWQEAQNGTGNVRSGSRSGFFPVKPGDVIQVNGNLERSCYFIPGIWT